MIARLTAAIALGTILCSAQDQPQSQPKTRDVRRFVFTLSELEDGRRTNSRNFEMLCREDTQCSLKTGSRVPISTSNKDFQYVDVGLDARVHYRLRSDGKLDVDAHFEMSNVASQRKEDIANGQLGLPLLRQTRSDVDAVLGANAPTSLASVQDLSSGHTYELSVIAKDK